MSVLSCPCRFVKKYLECDLLGIAGGSQLTHAGHVGPFNPTAYHLYGNFAVPSNGTGNLLAAKTGIGLNFTIYKIPANFSLSLERNPGTGNPSRWHRKFRSFRRKKGSRALIPFPFHFERLPRRLFKNIPPG